MTDRHTNKIAQTELPLKSPADQACLGPVAAVTALFTNNLPGAGRSTSLPTASYSVLNF